MSHTTITPRVHSRLHRWSQRLCQSLALALIFIGLGNAPLAFATFSAEINPTAIGPNDSCTLTLSEDQHISDDPDLQPLQQNFIIQEQNRGTTLQIINGSMIQRTEIQLTLIPRHTGTLRIPPLRWGKEISQPLQLYVGTTTPPSGPPPSAPTQIPGTSMNPPGAPAPAQPSASVPELSISETLDQRTPYTQAAVLLTVQIHTRAPLYQASLDLAATADVLVRDFGKDQQFQETVQGQNYQVIQRQYLLIPQKPGELELPGPVLEAQVQDNNLSSLFGPGAFGSAFGMLHPLHRQGDPIHLSVRPWPQTAQGAALLPAAAFNVQVHWPKNLSALHPGDPVTVHVHEEATGLTAEALPDLSNFTAMPAQIQHYPDPPKLDTQPQGNTVRGTRDQDIALIASQAGTYTLPQQQISWWNTQTGQPAVIRLPEQTLQIQAEAAATSTSGNAASISPPGTLGNTASQHPPLNCSTPGHQPGSTNRWVYLSMALGLGWLGSLLGTIGWYRRQRCNTTAITTSSTTLHTASVAPRHSAAILPEPPRNAKAARQQFLHYCLTDQCTQARQALLHWAQLHWKLSSPLTLDTLLSRLTEEQKQQVLQLDAACYGTTTQWRGQELASVLQTLPPLPPSPSTAPDPLPPDLYS